MKARIEIDVDTRKSVDYAYRSSYPSLLEHNVPNPVLLSGNYREPFENSILEEWRLIGGMAAVYHNLYVLCFLDECAFNGHKFRADAFIPEISTNDKGKIMEYIHERNYPMLCYRTVVREPFYSIILEQ